MRTGNAVEALDGAIGTFMLLLPLAGITLSYLLLCRAWGPRSHAAEPAST